MKQKLLAFAGGMGSGKDTMREALIASHHELGDNIKEFHFSFAAPLKDELNEILASLKEFEPVDSITEKLGLTVKDVCLLLTALNGCQDRYPEVNSRSRTPEIRKALQVLGTDIRRNANPDYWTNKAKDIILNKLEEGYTVIMTDARFNNEFKLIQELGGMVILLDTPESERIERIKKRDGITPSSDALNHSSEQDFKTYPNFDHVIHTSEQDEHDTLEAVIDFVYGDYAIYSVDNNGEILEEKGRFVSKDLAEKLAAENNYIVKHTMPHWKNPADYL